MWLIPSTSKTSWSLLCKGFIVLADLNTQYTFGVLKGEGAHCPNREGQGFSSLFIFIHQSYFPPAIPSTSLVMASCSIVFSRLPFQWMPYLLLSLYGVSNALWTQLTKFHDLKLPSSSTLFHTQNGLLDSETASVSFDVWDCLKDTCQRRVPYDLSKWGSLRGSLNNRDESTLCTWMWVHRYHFSVENISRNNGLQCSSGGMCVGFMLHSLDVFIGNGVDCVLILSYGLGP